MQHGRIEPPKAATSAARYAPQLKDLVGLGEWALKSRVRLGTADSAVYFLSLQFSAKMAAVAVGGKLEVHQVGEVTVGEQTELMYAEDDKDNAALIQKKTRVAAVPLEDGTTAVLTNVEYTVAATDPAQNEQELGELRLIIRVSPSIKINTRKSVVITR